MADTFNPGASGNFFDQFDEDTDGALVVTPPQSAEDNPFDTFDADPDAAPPSEPAPPSAPTAPTEAPSQALKPLEDMPGISFSDDPILSGRLDQLDAVRRKQAEDEKNQASGEGFIAGIKASIAANRQKTAQTSLDVLQRIDKGEEIAPQDDPLGLRLMTPEQQKAMRASFQQNIADPTRDPFAEGALDPQQYIEVGKGVPPGAVRFGGSVLQGVAAAQSAPFYAKAQVLRNRLKAFDAIDRGEHVTNLTLTHELFYQTSSPEERAKQRAELEQQIAQYSYTPPQERAAYKTGTEVIDYAATILPAEPGYEEAVGRQLGEGLGSMVAGLPFGVIGRIPALAAFASAGSGEALQRAIQYDAAERAAGRAGLTQDQITAAGILGVAPGSTDILPVETLLGRLKIPMPWRAPLARAIARIGGQAFAEGAQEGVQQFMQNLIAQEIYNPEQRLTEGVTPNAGMGAGVGGLAQTAKEVGALILKSMAGRRARRMPFPGDRADLQPTGEAPAVEPVEQAPTEAERFTPRIARPTESAGVDVVQFIRGKGGIKPSGELSAVNAERYPGLVRESGLEADKMREALVEAGYLEEAAPDQPAVTTPQDVYDLVARQIEGERVFPIAERAGAASLADERQAYEQDRELVNQEQNFVLPELARIDDEVGADVVTSAYARLSNDEKAEVIERHVRGGEAVDDIIEEIAVRNQDEPAVAALTIGRAVRTGEAQAIRDAVEQKAPDLVAEFDDMIAALPEATGLRPAAVSEPAPTTAAISDDTRRAFADLIDSRTPVSQWADRLGITQGELTPLIDEAVNKGWLQRDANGNVRRAQKTARTGTIAPMAIADAAPTTVPGEGDVGLTPQAEEKWAGVRAAIDKAAARILPDAVSVEVKEAIQIARLRQEDQLYAVREMNAAFWRWFGDSKVVDENGQPLVVYKGMPMYDWETGGPIKKIRSKTGPWAGFFTSKPESAAKFAEAFYYLTSVDKGKGQPVGTVAAHLSMQQPFELDAGGRPARDFMIDHPFKPEKNHPELRSAIESDLYDGVIIRNTSDEGDIFVPKNPTQIKSIFNRGTYDPLDPRISYALRKMPPETQAGFSAIVDEETQPEPAREQPPENRIAAGREGVEAATAEPAPGAPAGAGEGLPAGLGTAVPGLARATDERIIRQESASLRGDGSIIVGRQSREVGAAAEGKAAERPQPLGAIEDFDIKGYDGRVTADFLEEGDLKDGNLARLSYRIYQPGQQQGDPAEIDRLEKQRERLQAKLEKARSGSTTQAKLIDRLVTIDERLDDIAPIAKMHVVQRSDGAWEVGYVSSRQPQQGIGTKLYDAVEKDLGIRMSPSGVLTDAGLAFWQKRSPASVQWHVATPTWGGFNFSPRKILDELQRVTTEVRRLEAGVGTARHIPVDQREQDIVRLQKERGQLRRLYGDLPQEARARRVLDQMFALRGFYSPAIRTAEGLIQTKGTGEQFWKQITKAPGVRKDELEWMGLEEFLAGKKSVTKDEVLAFMRAHQIELDEKVLGDTISPDIPKQLSETTPEDVLSKTKWSQDWFEQAEAVWSYRVGDEQYYITKNSPDEDSAYSVFASDGDRLDFDPSTLEQAQHMLVGHYAEGADNTGMAIFADYKVPGGENYRELLIRFPALEEPRPPIKEEQARLRQVEKELADAKELEKTEKFSPTRNFKISSLTKELRELQAREPTYTSPHFQDQEIVHLRVDDRTGPNGEKVLFINEVQSDLHQVARQFGYGKEGYRKAVEFSKAPLSEVEERQFDEAKDQYDALSKQVAAFIRSPKVPSQQLLTAEHEAFRKFEAIRKIKVDRLQKASLYMGRFGEAGAPDAPFKGDLWLELALKRALLYAAENGYDAVSWARSDQIAKAVGGDAGALSVQYDQKIGRFLSKYTKKWGGKVESTSFEELGPARDARSATVLEMYNDGIGGVVREVAQQLDLNPSRTLDEVLADLTPQQRAEFDEIVGMRVEAKPTEGLNPFLRITPKMRASVMEGQPLAMRRQPSATQPEALGQTDPYKMAISIAMRAVEAEAKAKGVSVEQEAVRVLRHESVEFFKEMGLFTDKEWATLKSAAKRLGWVETTGVRAAYEAIYKGGMSEAELEDLLVKEAIAEQFSEYYLGRKQYTGVVAEVFSRIKDFIRRLANFMRKEGFRTHEDVFDALEEGEFRERFNAAFPEVATEASARQGVRPMQQIVGRIPDQLVRQARPGTETPGHSLGDIIGDFNRALGLTVRQGRLDPALRRQAAARGGEVRGQTSLETGVVRLLVPDEIDTLAHEGGHALENRFGKPLDVIKGQFDTELTPLASPGPDALSEGFSEWFRRYVTNPKAAQAAAPGFQNAFEEFLTKNDPNMLTWLKEIQSGFQDWINAPSGGVVASDMVSSVPPGSVKAAVREFKQEGLANTMQAWTDRIYTAVFDDLHPIRLAVDGLLDIAAKNLGVARNQLGLKVANDAYKLLRLARDAYAAGHMFLLYGVHDYQSTQPQGPSLRDAMAVAFGGFGKGQWNKQIENAFNAYLRARRMVQEWGRFKRGEISAPPDKFSLADHEQAIRDFEAAHPGFKEGAQMVYAYLSNLLRYKRDAGLITDELYNELIQRRDYVPVMRDMSSRGRGVEGGAPARKDKFFRIFRFRGSQRAVINPLESIAKDTYETAMIVARNDAIKALDALARAAGPDGGRFAERIPPHEMKATQVNLQEAIKSAARDAGLDPADTQIMLQAVDDQLGDNAITRIWRAGDISEKGEAIVYLWEGGKRIPIRLADGQFGHDMLHAVTGINREATGWLVNAFSLPSTVLRTGVTASLDFIGANYIRDQVSAFILTRDFIPFYDGARGIYNDLTMSDLSRIYSRVGGIMGGSNVAAQHESRIKREVSQLRRRGIRLTLNPFTRDFWRMTEFSETGTRLSVFDRAFKRAKHDGLSDWEASVEAAFIARDYIDFGRRGSRMLAIRRLVPFFNAALQGLDRGVRGMRGKVDAQRALRSAISPYIKSRTGQPLSIIEKQNLQQSAQVWAYMATLGLVGLALSWLYKDDEEYEEISDYMKATHWLFRVNGEWVRIPKPFELAWVSNLMERTFDYTYKNDPTAVDRFIDGLYQITVPPHSVPGLTVGTELAADYNFFTGRPIVGPFLKSLPPELQFNAYASEFSKYFGKQVGVSPAYLDHFITGFGASWGREFVNASDQFMPALGRGLGGAFNLPTYPTADPAVQDYFFLRRFTTDPTRGSTSVRQFWDMIAMENGSYTQAASGYKHLAEKVRDARGAQEFLDRLPDEERAYALLMAGNSGGRSKYRRLHPLERAKEIVTIAGGMKKEINLNRLYEGKDGAQIVLSPSEMRTVTDLLSDITMREARNALVALKQRGWAQKKPLDVDSVYAELEAVSAAVHRELVDRLRSKKLPSYETVVKSWPVARDRILEDEADALIFDLYEQDFSIGKGEALQ